MCKRIISILLPFLIGVVFCEVVFLSTSIYGKKSGATKFSIPVYEVKPTGYVFSYPQHFVRMDGLLQSKIIDEFTYIYKYTGIIEDVYFNHADPHYYKDVLPLALLIRPEQTKPFKVGFTESELKRAVFKSNNAVITYKDLKKGQHIFIKVRQVSTGVENSSLEFIIDNNN